MVLSLGVVDTGTDSCVGGKMAPAVGVGLNLESHSRSDRTESRLVTAHDGDSTPVR